MVNLTEQLIDLDSLPPPIRKKHPTSRGLDAKRAAQYVKKNRKATEAITKQLENEAEKLKIKQSALRRLQQNIIKKDKIITLEDIQATGLSEKKLFNNREVIFAPNPGPQTDFLAATENQVFYGGARGGGKSMAMIVDPLRYVHNPIHRVLIVRRTMPELRDLIGKSLMLYSKVFPMPGGAKWSAQEKVWKFPSGATIEFGYGENMQDVQRYQGQNYTAVYFDELPQYATPEIFNFINTSVRSTDPELPVYIRASGNPGNVGSSWVKEMFIDPAPPNTRFEVIVDTPLGHRRITRRFIPAKLQDNPYLLQTDDYLIMLASLPEIQRKQFLEGDWDAFDKAAFPEFHRETHVVKPFDIPSSWFKFRACDYGYSSPFCVLWIAVDYDGCLYVYRELYGKGMTGDILARKVLELETRENIRYGTLDSSVWATRGQPGPSIAEIMIKEGCRWMPSDRGPGSRKAGKVELHRRLKLRDNGLIQEPSLKVFDTCKNTIKQLLTLPLDDNDPEDVDTKAEDHAYDALRYGVMSRPINPAAFRDMFGSGVEKLKKRMPADRKFGY